MRHLCFDSCNVSLVHGFQSECINPFLYVPTSVNPFPLFTALQVCQVAADFIVTHPHFVGRLLFIRQHSPLTSAHSYAICFVEDIPPFPAAIFNDDFGRDFNRLVNNSLSMLGYYSVAESRYFDHDSMPFSRAYLYFRNLLGF